MPRFFRRLAPGVFDMEDLSHRTDELRRFVDAAATHYGFARDNVIAVGLSNGANIAGNLLLTHGAVLRGAILFRAMPTGTGAVPGPGARRRRLHEQRPQRSDDQRRHDRAASASSARDGCVSDARLGRGRTSADPHRRGRRAEMARSHLSFTGLLVRRCGIDDEMFVATAVSMTSPWRRWVLASVALVSVAVTVPPQVHAQKAAPSAQQLLDAASTYLRSVYPKLTSLVATEEYVQERRLESKAKRQLRSDVLLVQHPVDKENWLAFRDVLEVDGRSIDNHQERLQRLFIEPTIENWMLVGDIASASQQYHLEGANVSVTNPFVVVALIGPVLSASSAVQTRQGGQRRRAQRLVAGISGAPGIGIGHGRRQTDNEEHRAAPVEGPGPRDGLDRS